MRSLLCRNSDNNSWIEETSRRACRRLPLHGRDPIARYKYIDTNPRFLPVDLARRLLPERGDRRAGVSLAMLLKVVRVLDAHGIVSNRGIGQRSLESLRAGRD